MSDNGKHFLEFDEFRLDCESASLWRAGELVNAPPKAIEILILLATNHGEIVSREALLENVWKDTFVEEGNINYTISLLRKTLGEQEFIQTVPRRGYRFIPEVREVSGNGNTNEDAIASEMSLPPSRGWVLISAVAAVVLLTSFSWWLTTGSGSVPISERSFKSLAVLPLRNLNKAEPDDTFSAGLNEALISRLGSLDRFSVRPIETVEKFGKSEKDAIVFASSLKADAVFEGTFQNENGRVRVSARVLDVRDGAQIWVGSFDQAEAEIFELQDKLATQIAQSIGDKLTEKDQKILAKRQTENAEAYRAYVRGRSILDQKLPEKFEKAAAEFQRAINLDPTFSLAYSGMADAYSRRGNNLSGDLAGEYYSKARAYAQRAVELDPESAEAYVAIGRIRRIRDWDWAGAEQDFRRAIELNPNNADAHLFYGQMLGFLGRFDEAFEEIDRAFTINPISIPVTGARYALLESSGDIDKALKLAEENLAFDKENQTTNRAVGTFLFNRGEYTRVIEMGESLISKEGQQNFAWYSLLSTAYSRTNQPERSAEMLRRLEELSQTDTKALYSLAVNYSEFGRVDDAIWALNKCLEMREERIVWINVEPRFAGLRRDYRFQEILAKLNFKSM